jgi:hypothetical protein
MREGQKCFILLESVKMEECTDRRIEPYSQFFFERVRKCLSKNLVSHLSSEIVANDKGICRKAAKICKDVCCTSANNLVSQVVKVQAPLSLWGCQAICVCPCLCTYRLPRNAIIRCWQKSAILGLENEAFAVW